MVLLTEEESVERDSFCQCHTNDGLDEDLNGSAGIAADGFNSLRTDKTYAKGGTKAAKSALDATGDFSDE